MKAYRVAKVHDTHTHTHKIERESNERHRSMIVQLHNTSKVTKSTSKVHKNWQYPHQKWQQKYIWLIDVTLLLCPSHEMKAYRVAKVHDTHTHTHKIERESNERHRSMIVQLHNTSKVTKSTSKVHKNWQYPHQKWQQKYICIYTILTHVSTTTPKLIRHDSRKRLRLPRPAASSSNCKIYENEIKNENWNFYY